MNELQFARLPNELHAKCNSARLNKCDISHTSLSSDGWLGWLDGTGRSWVILIHHQHGRECSADGICWRVQANLSHDCECACVCSRERARAHKTARLRIGTGMKEGRAEKKKQNKCNNNQKQYDAMLALCLSKFRIFITISRSLRTTLITINVYKYGTCILVCMVCASFAAAFGGGVCESFRNVHCAMIHIRIPRADCV